MLMALREAHETLALSMLEETPVHATTHPFLPLGNANHASST